MKGNKINSNSRMASDTIWGIVLLVVLFIILACVFGFTCSNRKRIKIMNNMPITENMTNKEEEESQNINEEFNNTNEEEVNESFENCNKEPNFNDPNWRNNRFYQYSNVAKLEPTNPIHVPNQTINTVLLEHNDLQNQEQIMESFNNNAEYSEECDSEECKRSLKKKHP